MKSLLTLSIVLALFVAGCFTVSETSYPRVSFRSDAAAATNITLAVRGFATTLTEYTVVSGYQTFFYDDGPYYYGGGPGIATARTTTVVPHQVSSDVFLNQAKTHLEDLGFNVMAQTPDYVVEARFSGPVTSSGDTAKSVAWFVCTLLTCEYGAESWQAQLRIHDNRTGRLVLTRDYTQRYEVTGFSPIPLFGISYYDRTSSRHMQGWCLSALTEQIVADTAEFLTL